MRAGAFLQGVAAAFIKKDRSWKRMISCPCPISWRKNTALLQCDLFKEVHLYGPGRVELTSQAGHYSTSSSCPCFSQDSWSLLSFLPGKIVDTECPSAATRMWRAAYC